MNSFTSTSQLSGRSRLNSSLVYQPDLRKPVTAEERFYLGAFATVLALYCAWVLSLPAFPTQDGALHLYYVHALHQLAAGNSMFRNSYALRSPLPPYTVQYAIQYALTSVMDSLWAEKIIVCLILITTATGFRALAKSIGETGALVSLWIFPVILGWALFMGFHNFCLSLGLSLWALAFWLRAAAGRPGYFILFGCAVLVVGFTHPVPLLMMIGCLFVDLCVRIFNLRSANGLSWKDIAARLRLELVVFGAAASSISYLALFVNSSHVGTAVARQISIMTWLGQLALLQHMCLGSGGGSTKLFRFILATNLLFFFWLGWRRFKSMGALLFAGFDLAMAERLIRPVARDMMELETSSAGIHSKAGLVVGASRMVGSRWLSGNPYFLWSGARFFRRSNTLLLNDPWAGPPNILPINRSVGPRLNSYLSNFELLNPLQLRRELLDSKEARDRILSRIDLVFFVGIPQSGQIVDPLLALSGRAWTCH